MVVRATHFGGFIDPLFFDSVVLVDDARRWVSNFVAVGGVTSGSKRVDDVVYSGAVSGDRCDPHHVLRGIFDCDVERKLQRVKPEAAFLDRVLAVILVRRKVGDDDRRFTGDDDPLVLVVDVQPAGGGVVPEVAFVEDVAVFIGGGFAGAGVNDDVAATAASTVAAGNTAASVVTTQTAKAYPVTTNLLVERKN